MIPDRVRRRPRRHGVAIVAIGILLLLVLRFWASPVGRRITGRSDVGVVAFLGIPLFLVLVTVGIAVFLFEPAERGDG